jgi:hypothetical protein
VNNSAEYFDEASLAFAAYADLSGAASTYLQALRAADMSASQASNFLEQKGSETNSFLNAKPML